MVNINLILYIRMCNLDELIRDVLLGGLYAIIGIPVYQLCGASASIDISIEVLTLGREVRMYNESSFQKHVHAYIHICTYVGTFVP